MVLIQALRRLWRNDAFRRLVVLRTFSQAGDGTLQVGMASYILFSPQHQPNAWAIAGVLALTLLPYTLLGPVLSPLLDRWPRRDIALYSDLARACLCLVIGSVIAAGATEGPWAIVLFGALLIALSVNRFMLAGLSAGLQHTVDDDEYLTASSILPTLGPLGVVTGAVLGFAARAGLGPVAGVEFANAAVFCLAAALFVGSVMACRGFARQALGPDEVGRRPSLARVVQGLGAAVSHLASRPAALLAISLMAATRMLFGLFSVSVILAARNLWHPVDRPELALADLTLWGLASGGGFVLAAAVTPVMVRRVGLGCGAAVMLGAAAAVFGVLWLTASPVTVLAASLLIGVAVQSFKIAVDTVVQAHIDEGLKGRVFTLYDMGFNAAFVLAGIVAAVVLPPQGLTAPAMTTIGAGYAMCAVAWLAGRRRLGSAALEQGTEDLARGADV